MLLTYANSQQYSYHQVGPTIGKQTQKLTNAGLEQRLLAICKKPGSLRPDFALTLDLTRAASMLTPGGMHPDAGQGFSQWCLSLLG
jgi:hypothetical protein